MDTDAFEPRLGVNKEASYVGADGFELFGEIYFTIIVSNDGNETLTDVTLSDLFMGAPVTIGTLAPGEIAPAVTYTYASTYNDYIGGVIWNEATVTGRDRSGNEVTATDRVDVFAAPKLPTLSVSKITAQTETSATEPPSPVLSITKTTEQTEVRAGEDISYTITVTNSGLGGATGVKVTENLPANATFKSATTVNGSYNSGTGIWDLGDLAAGGTATLTVVLTVNVTVVDGDTVANTVSITEENGETLSNPPTDDTETPVKNPNLAISKTTAQTEVRAGEDITYVITVTNSGQGDAAGVKVTENLPSNATFWGASTASGTYNLTTNVWTVGDLAAGATATLIIVLVVNDDVMDGETVANAAAITEENGETLQNPPADETETPVKNPNLTISKTTAQTEVRAGEDITYVITVANSGQGDATGVKVTERLPANATFKGAATVSGSYDAVTGIWNLGNLAASGTATLTLVLTANANAADGETVANAAAITEENGETLQNPPADETETPVKNPNLTISKTTAQTEVRAGEDITYVITVANSGQGDATGVKVTESLPLNTTFWSASTASGTYDLATGVWTVGNITAGATATLIIVLAVNDDVANGDTVVNAVGITGENGETLENPLTVETDTPVKMPNLSIEKSTSQTHVQAGEDITYTITVTNRGPGDATGVVVMESIPTNATYKSYNATAGVFDIQTAKWTIDTVAAEGGFETLTLTLTINNNVQEGHASNRVIIAEANGYSNPNGPEDTVVTPILNPALRIVKSASEPAGSTLASAGGKLTYQIQVFNDGHAEARNLMITDLVPAQCTFVSASCPEATSVSFDKATDTLRCEIAELAAGRNATIAMTVNVNAWSQIGTRTIRNTAKLYFQNATLDSNTVQHLQTNTDSSDVPVTGENDNAWIFLMMMAALLALAGTLTWLVIARPKWNKG